jgi:hypothetical protein
MSYADAISQLAAACKNDIARYCKGVPLGPRLKDCFDANGARMSPQCQQTRGVVYTSISRRAAAQRNIGDACRYRQTMRHILCGCPSRRMPAQCVAGGDEPAKQSDVQRYRLAYGKGAAMKPHHISLVAAILVLWAIAIGASAQQQINSGQMATSLAGVTSTKLSLTGAQMRQAVLDNIRNYPGVLPPRPLTFPQLENLAQFIVEVDFDFIQLSSGRRPTGRSAPSPMRCIIPFCSAMARNGIANR